MIFVTGSGIWEYFTSPFRLTHPEVSAEEIEP